MGGASVGTGSWGGRLGLQIHVDWPRADTDPWVYNLDSKGHFGVHASNEVRPGREKGGAGTLGMPVPTPRSRTVRQNISNRRGGACM
jgi:hypothetical protein